MSDTPRTDEQINGKPCTRFAILAGDSLRDALVPSEFARGLERELDSANKRIKRLEEVSESTWNLADTAIGSCAEMSSRIKRLEEAGDAHMEWVPVSFQSAWHKAKEAKL